MVTCVQSALANAQSVPEPGLTVTARTLGPEGPEGPELPEFPQPRSSVTAIPKRPDLHLVQIIESSLVSPLKGGVKVGRLFLVYLLDDLLFLLQHGTPRCVSFHAS